MECPFLKHGLRHKGSRPSGQQQAGVSQHLAVPTNCSQKLHRMNDIRLQMNVVHVDK